MELSEKLTHIELAHNELATVVWGDDKKRDNGLRSRVNKMAEVEIPEIKTAISVLQGCLDDQREKLDTHIETHKTVKKDEATVQAEKVRMYGTIIVSIITNMATLLTILLKK